jgi:hypothetical protein
MESVAYPRSEDELRGSRSAGHEISRLRALAGIVPAKELIVPRACKG